MQRLVIFAALLILSHTCSAQLNANFNADVKSGCSPLVVNFQDQSTGNPAQWIWTLGNGTTSFIKNPVTTYFVPGVYSVKLVIKNAAGADSIVKTQFITVHANPLVAFSVSDSVGCYPKTVQFTDQSVANSGSIAQRTWDFGDGNISTQSNPVHTYTNPGVYNVTLKVTNSNGCQKTLHKPGIIRLENPGADFSFSTASGCDVTTSINFTDHSSGAIMRNWNFGDGNSSNALHPTHTYNVPGTYDVKLIVTGANGCKDSVTKQIIVGVIKADFIYNTACEISDIVFQNTSSPTPVSATWDFGDGTSSSDINPVKKYIAAGNYNVRLISDMGGCIDTVIKTIIVYPIPSPLFAYSGEAVRCAPNATVNFNAAASGVNYQWIFGDGATGNTKSPSHTYTAYGNYDVTLIATSSFGCTDTFVSPGLVKIQAPDIINIDGLFRGCAPYSAKFTPIVSSVDPVESWAWDLGDGTTSTDKSPSNYYPNAGTYPVKLSITTSTGCVDTVTYSTGIQISNKPTAAFTAAPLTTCAAGPIQFTNTSTGADFYLWTFNDGGFSTVMNPAHQFGDTGIFTIMLIAERTGCRDTFSIENYVRNDPPIARFNVIQDCRKPYEVQFRDTSLGGQTYFWKFGDGTSSTLKHPAHTYQATGIYEVELTVFHDTCSYTTTSYVTVIDEHPQITVSDTAICRNGTVVFGADNINASNIVNYHWKFDDDINIPFDTTAAYAEHLYQNNGTFKPILITTDVLGCLDTASNVLELNVYGPFAGFANQPGTCVNSNVVFQNTSLSDGIHAISNWAWKFGDGTHQQSSSGPFIHNYTAKGIYDVQLKVTDNFGCSDSVFTSSAVIITDPGAGFISADSIKCSSNSVVFNNFSDGLNLQFAWKFGDGATSSDIQPAHTYQAEGAYDVQLNITDQFGCKDSLARKQYISNPSAKFIASDTIALCPPLLVNLSNQSTSYSSASWDFGDGSIADISDPSHYYTYPGTYQLKLRSTGFGNCVDSASRTIIVKGPTGAFNISPKSICANASVSFTATSKDNNRFFWDFSDGNILVTQDSTASHMYDVPGFYQPRLILIDTAGCEVPLVSPDTLKVLGVKAKIGFDNKLFCDSALIQFKDSSVVHNDLPSLYRWDFGDGYFSDMPNPVHHYKTPGTYITKLIITTQAGCTDSASAASPVNIFKSPRINIAGNTSLCVNETLSFTGEIIQPDSSALQWNWDFGNGQISSVQNPSQLFDIDGTFNVTAIARYLNGCSDTAGTNILVHPLPDVNAGTDTMICRGKTYTLQPTGAASYKWQSDVTLSCTDCTAPLADPVFRNVYYVTGVSQFGCKADDSVVVDVMQPFVIGINRDDSVCKGSSVQMIANGAAKYNWYPSTGLNNAMIGNPVATPSVTTAYMVIGSDVKNCFSDTGYVKLSVFPVPQFSIIDKLITLPAGSGATIKTTNSSDITSWKWYPAKDLSCADCPQPVITAKENAFYRAEVKNNGGCTAKDEVTVTVICDDGNVFIPNTFSPNNDGMNDVFYPRGKGITEVKSMKIFNRWGQVVYEKSNFSANDAAAGWNGSNKGSVLTPDVYVYIVDVVCNNSTVFTLKGNVTLIR